MNQNSPSHPPTNGLVSGTTRRFDFDWLKVAATGAVFIFHCLRFFDLDPWHVKNQQLDAIATILALLLVQWMMPLFFLLSGASIFFALKFRTAAQFLRERCTRLLIPLIFGILILSPPQVYLERLTNPDYGVAPWNGGLQFSGSFWEFLPFYFQGWYLFGGNFAWMGMHLWYLLALFVFSLLLLPLFLMLQQGQGAKLMAKLGGVLNQPRGIFLVGLPIGLLESGFDPASLGFRAAGGWNLFSYLAFLFSGYLIVRDQRIQQAVERNFLAALAIACLTTPLLLAALVNLPLEGEMGYGSWGYTLVILLKSWNSWCWMLAFLGLSSSFLNFNHPLLEYMSPACLPFYMLHQPIIIGIGCLMAGLPMAVWPKFILLSALALAAIALLYEFLIRRMHLLRLCFGLKPV